MIDVSFIRDRRINGWGTVKENVPVRLDPAGNDVYEDRMLGRVVVKRFTAYFQGGEPVLVNDLLKITVNSVDVYYRVDGLADYTEFDGHLQAEVREQEFSQKDSS